MHLEIGQIVSQIIAFLIMLWILKRYAWKPLLGILEERRDKIKTDFQTIENQKKANDNLLDEYRSKLKEIDNQARTKMQEGIDEGRKKAVEIQNQAHDEAKAIISKAKADLQKEIVKARQQLKNDIVNLTMKATTKIIGDKLDTAKENQLVADVIDKTEVN